MENYKCEYFHRITAMAEKEKVQLPATGGGLFRPSEAGGKGLKIKPEHIIIFSAAVVVIEIVLRLYFA